MSTLVFANARIFDGVSDTVVDNGYVLVEDEKIVEVREGENKTNADRVVDCKGQFLMPGLIDLHFHAYSATFDFEKLDKMPESLLVSYAVRILEGALKRGFTTVRDPGGGDIGLHLAIESNLIHGPRFFYGGKAFSQTGGHGDLRHAEHQQPCSCAYAGVLNRVVDGVDEIRKAAREELRKGADHIKLMMSGGISSPTDPVWMPQFQDDEVKAAVAEAVGRRKYVVAHCHTDDSARRCVELGIRSIEHATDLSQETANRIADSGTCFTVPTFAVLHQIQRFGEETGMSLESIKKCEGALDSMKRSLERSRKAGVKVGLGTDLFGMDYHFLQSQEIAFRSELERPIDTLRSATSVNAEIIQRSDCLGRIAPGYLADVIVVNGDPLTDPTAFSNESAMGAIMKSGVLYKNDFE